jgi:hypothetical protein
MLADFPLLESLCGCHFVKIVVIANFLTRRNRRSILALETWDGRVEKCFLLAQSPCREIFDYFNRIYDC